MLMGHNYRVYSLLSPGLRVDLRRLPQAIFPPSLRAGFCKYADEFPKPHIVALQKICLAKMQKALSDDEAGLE